MVDNEEEEKSFSFKILKKWWDRIKTTISVIGLIVAGILWVDDRIDEVAQHTVDLSDLKVSTSTILAKQESINKLIVSEFQTRDNVDVELKDNIDAVLVELRARHGVITLVGSPPIKATSIPRQERVRLQEEQRQRIQEAQEHSDVATLRSGNALPQADPLVGVGSL